MYKQILFIGDKPGNKNVNDKLAFVGTKSYDKLLSWISKLQLSINQINVVNSTDCIITFIEPDMIEYNAPDHAGFADKIICLGNNAEKFIKSYGIENYFKLPHPSGMNRKLNDKKYEKQILNECKEYIQK